MLDVNDLSDETQPDQTHYAHAREAGKKFRQGAFLSAYGQLGKINKAAERAGVDRWTHFNWMKTDPEYAEQFERAEVLAVQQAEDELFRRAVDGWETLKTV